MITLEFKLCTYNLREHDDGTTGAGTDLMLFLQLKKLAVATLS